MSGGMIWPIRVRLDQLAAKFETRSLYLTDDRTTKSDDHSPADDLTPHHKVPALVERLEELAED
jgi:hypothetical protein